MGKITVTQAEARLTEYMTAESKVLKGQAYSIGGRTMTRADLKEIQEGIALWERRVAKLSRRGLSMKFGTPV